MKSFVFDLDNTLVFTDALNNEAYNFALKQQQREPIAGVQRITREIVFSRYTMTQEQKRELVALKQSYFIENIKKVLLNDKLISFLRELPEERCVLWTSAEEARVESILEFFDLKKCFAKVFYSKKHNVERDLLTICDFLKCTREELIVFDDEVTGYQA